MNTFSLMPLTPLQQKAQPRGFTLVELMISMSITLVIIGVLLSMTGVAVKGLKNGQDSTRSSRLAEEVLDNIAKDLESVVIKKGNNYEWLLARESSISDEDLGPKGNKIQNPFELSFFAFVTDRYNGSNDTKINKGGDICMIRYQIIHQDQILQDGKYKTFTLYRQRVEPDITFKKCLTAEDLTSIDLKGSDTIKITDRENYLASNIFDLTISFNLEYKDENNKTLLKRVILQINNDDADNSFSIKGDSINIDGVKIDDLAGARLISADISIMVLTDSGMAGLEKRSFSSTELLSEYLQQNGKQYSTTVILPSP